MPFRVMKRSGTNALRFRVWRDPVWVSVAVALAAVAFETSAAAGEAVYKQKCSACHDSGAGDAPRIGVPADWTQRFPAGRASLYDNAVRGMPNTAMAPKGGFADLSDEEVRAAVDYMLVRTAFTERAPAAPARAPVAPAASRAQQQSALSDAQLRQQVAQALRDAIAPSAPIEPHGNELIVRGTGVRVSAEDGAVRLLGVVSNGATLQRAETAARAISGVKSVDNRLITGGMLEFD
jgi:cytochrome c5